MLKLNTVLTALAVVLLGVVSWITSRALSEIHDTHDSVTAMSVQVQVQAQQLADHEQRIRKAEGHILMLEAVQADPARAPKLHE